MNKKAEGASFGFRHILLLLLAISLILFVIIWYSDLGSKAKDLVLAFLNIF